MGTSRSINIRVYCVGIQLGSLAYIILNIYLSFVGDIKKLLNFIFGSAQFSLVNHWYPTDHTMEY